VPNIARFDDGCGRHAVVWQYLNRDLGGTQRLRDGRTRTNSCAIFVD
jgi:hypothetical protein